VMFVKSAYLLVILKTNPISALKIVRVRLDVPLCQQIARFSDPPLRLDIPRPADLRCIPRGFENSLCFLGNLLKRRIDGAAGDLSRASFRRKLASGVKKFTLRLFFYVRVPRC